MPPAISVSWIQDAEGSFNLFFPFYLVQRSKRAETLTSSLFIKDNLSKYFQTEVPSTVRLLNEGKSLTSCIAGKSEHVQVKGNQILTPLVIPVLEEQLPQECYW